MLRKLIKILILLFVFLVAGIYFLDWFTTHRIMRHSLSEPKKKAWSHSGYYNNSEYKANTIESFTNALNNNATGVELDVFYDNDMKKYIVAHDYPYSTQYGKHLFLDSVFATFGNSFKYWLDFKNLKDLNEEDVLDSQLILNNYLKIKRIEKENLLIESTHLENLSHFTEAGFYTSWWILPYKSRYRSILRNYKYKFYYLLGKYSSLSMPYSYYPRVEQEMNKIPVNLWTINDKEVFLKTVKKPQVKIILTDQNWFDN
ncbi:hypothetical protein [Christiangramia salexigens]|uniref:GP-PDE domain-containing protein n=1 Tax=Christiangramia salexigens TaxID=1913577 RepID=A0A1L3J4S4_9FLAO|nr:hypothetical protein [Christiangramia salexigens]APG60116.1 hypothetical protein LPB144_06660 [Christiangramia salexigens]